MNEEKLQKEYLSLLPSLERLQTCLRDQIEALVENSGVTLGVPLQYRIKEWQSVSEKIERNRLDLRSVTHIQDLVGIRTIFLFKNELFEFVDKVRQTFRVELEEDVADRLSEAQFGYQSLHLTVSLSNSWLDVPSYAGLKGLKAELQVRTLAQHIWAAASHKLQYKREQNVPLPIRRSIHRVSALLETVDLEFSRVLRERHEYIENFSNSHDSKIPLNVDILRKTLNQHWPKENRSPHEPYDILLDNLLHLGVTDAQELSQIIEKHKTDCLEDDKQIVLRGGRNLLGNSKERTEAGVFYTHAGLTRGALARHFAIKNWKDAIS